MNLRIHNYEILHFPSEDLVISEKGISRITSQALITALNAIKKCNALHTSKTELTEILIKYDLNTETTFDFLEKILVIKKSMTDSYFEKIIIIHDWGNELKNHLSPEISHPIEFYNFPQSQPKLEGSKKYFIFILCKNYSYAPLKNLYFEIAHQAPTSATSIGVVIGNTFTISPPYLFEIGNPCHFCHIDRLEQNDLISPVNNSWSRLLRFCKSQEKPLPLKNLTLLQQSLIFGSIIKHIDLYTKQGTAQRHQDSLFQISHTSLNNGTITEEPLSHWYMCDCLRPNQ